MERGSKFTIEGVLGLLEGEDNCVFLESARCDAENHLSYLFLRPKKIISAFQINEVENCFSRLDSELKKGNYLAGFLSYEAGCAFEEKLRDSKSYAFPLLWFGVYGDPLIYDHRKQDCNSVFSIKQDLQGYSLKNIRPNISQSKYIKAINKIKDLIAQGYTYQVNYTFKLKFPFSGSEEAFYLNLRNNQKVSYAALIKINRFSVLSFSPELFFRKKGCLILTRPMKGTIERGKDLKEDSTNAWRLKNCLKNRSENVMIVDLLRSDLGRISATGTVQVPRLFNVERYETLFQMTSDIKSRLKSSCGALDIFRHIFPSGSVTGAPKIKTMEIIKKLEKEPRKIYTGGIGFFSPQGQGVFNVAIRTIILDKKNKLGEMGVGSGIVYDSKPESEYAECRLKADFLTKKVQDFKLLETILWRPKRGYLLLKLHLKRLTNSARYFDFHYNELKILNALMRLTRHFGRHHYRMRLLLSKDGQIRLTSSVINIGPSEKLKVCFSAKSMQSSNPFLYHKTTCRRIYNEEYERCKSLGFYDVIFTNEKGEITEGAISNVFIRKNGRLYTPPVSCGLLDGVYRRYLLNTRRLKIKDKILLKKDLWDAEEIYLSNSVRGLVGVSLEGKGTDSIESKSN